MGMRVRNCAQEPVTTAQLPGDANRHFDIQEIEQHVGIHVFVRVQFRFSDFGPTATALPSVQSIITGPASIRDENCTGR
ncbi:hypothetical protein E4U55_003189 [Claviceps digitariae]|nr:hypothetical protein E4U55_003189 [Claviceps digitariae]